MKFPWFKKQDRLPERIEKYISPRQVKVDCSIRNPIHTKLREELKQGSLSARAEKIMQMTSYEG